MNALHPPHSIEAEQSVLGGLMLNNRAWFDVRAVLHPEDFFTHDHRAIYGAMARLADLDRPLDFVTLSEHLRANEQLEDAGGVSYLGTLAADTPSAANVLAYAEIVRERALLRALIAAGQDIADLGYRPEGRSATELVASGLASLEKLARANTTTVKTLREVVEGAVEAAKARCLLVESGEDFGPTTSLPAVDERIGAFAPGCLTIIGARPGVGKTAFINQCMRHSAGRGYPGLMFSMEMSERQLGARAAANIVGGKAIATGLLRGQREQIEVVSMGLAHNVAALRVPVYIDTETSDLAPMIALAHQYVRKFGVKLIAFDHLGLIEGVKADNRNNMIGVITRALKQLAKRLNVSVVALSQLTRMNEREARPPQLSDLRDSGNIEQDADLVMFLHEPPTDVVGDRPRMIGCFKNRDGREGWVGGEKDQHARIWFNGRTQSFYQVAA